MAATVSQFTEDLVRSGLMTAKQLREFRAALPERKHPTAESLARALVQHGLLTPYQAKRILEGKPEGLVLGNNVIQQRIGSGGMGEVFKAEHRRMKRAVVVKILHPENTKSEVAVRRFQREVEAAAKLSHPNIVTAFDADVDGQIHFLVMEYVDGEDLGSLINRLGPLDPDRALDYIIQAAQGIAFAHSRNIIHRDIKPGNLLVDRDGVVKVLDMGLARIDKPIDAKSDTEGDDSITEVNQIVGTVDYMSPEQADSSAGLDRRCDIYSLGCTLYRLIVGKPPYSGASTIKKLVAHRIDPIPSIRDARPDVPDSIDSVFKRMVAKSPEDRYATMEETIVELRKCRESMRLPRAETPTAGAERLPSAGGSDSTAAMGEATAEFQISEDTNLLVTSARHHRDPTVGIDLGTTYSVVAYLDHAGRPQTLVNT